MPAAPASQKPKARKAKGVKAARVKGKHFVVSAKMKQDAEDLKQMTKKRLLRTLTTSIKGLAYTKIRGKPGPYTLATVLDTGDVSTKNYLLREAMDGTPLAVVKKKFYCSLLKSVGTKDDKPCTGCTGYNHENPKGESICGKITFAESSSSEESDSSSSEESASEKEEIISVRSSSSESVIDVDSY